MHHLTWGLLVATKDRIEPLCECVSRALRQTRPPSEIVIADSSTEWQAHRDRIADIVSASPDRPRFVYMQGAAPSLTVQRNQTLDAGTADVFFMIDDDSFMHPDCADIIMEIYEADKAGVLAGVQASDSEHNPAARTAGTRKTGDIDLSRARSRSVVLRWFLETVMMRSMTAVFLPYDKAFHLHPLPEAIQRLDVFPMPMFGGFRMTYRRDAIRRERFDPCLRYYCPGEDLDASYRVSRHGGLVTSRRAKLYHHASATGRLKRIQVAHLWSFNQAVLLRRHAADQKWARRAWGRKMAHRIATDIIKDSLMRRLDYPQTRGSWRAWHDGRKVFRMDESLVESWYLGRQEDIVKG